MPSVAEDADAGKPNGIVQIVRFSIRDKRYLDAVPLQPPVKGYFALKHPHLVPGTQRDAASEEENKVQVFYTFHVLIRYRFLPCNKHHVTCALSKPWQNSKENGYKEQSKHFAQLLYYTSLQRV